MIRFVTLFAFFGVVVGAGIMTARGYYCRDPDTGKLYPVNASWPSSTFCGSYTCKIRKINSTDVRTVPFRQINFTKDFTKNASLSFDGSKVNLEVKSTFRPCSKTSVDYVTPETVVPKTDASIGVEIANKSKGETLEVIHNKKDDTTILMNKLRLNCSEKDENDRYLTEDEIKTLVDILHSIKKSDLLALIEMYNLAQSVYDELDTSASENVAEVIEHESNGTNIVKKDNENKHTPKKTYWYEPLVVPVNKHKGELDTLKDNTLPTLEEVSTVIEDKNIVLADGSNTNTITVAPNSNLAKPGVDLNDLGATLTKGDFRMLPYYYPISPFQRSSSYVNPNAQYTPNTKGANVIQEQQILMQPLFQANLLQSLLKNNFRSTPPQERVTTPSILQNPYAPPNLPSAIPHTNVLSSITPPKCGENRCHHQVPDSRVNTAGYKPHCKHAANNLQYLRAHPSWFNRIVKKPFLLDSKNRLLDPVNLFSPKEKKKIAHLPYPLTHLDYTNTSKQRSYNNEPWTVLDFMKGKEGPSYVKATYITHLPNTLVLNPIVEENKELPKNVRAKKLIGEENYEGNSEDNILEEMQNKKLQNIQLQKKVRLQKVGRLTKLESVLRRRREAIDIKKGETRRNGSSEEGEFEVYLARSECDADTTPGFFRMGNETEPFPACCPQRIGSKR